jgi:hypothetical protein
VQTLRFDRPLGGAPALNGSVAVQRDDNSPHPGGDVSVSAGTVPLTLQGTFVVRNLDLVRRASGFWEWDFGHEPNLSIIGDTSGTLSVQEAITLINAHWLKKNFGPVGYDDPNPPNPGESWQSNFELGLSLWLQETLYPALGFSAGAQAQYEIHITPTFSSTFSLNLAWRPPAAGQTWGTLSFQPGAGVLWHFIGP